MRKLTPEEMYMKSKLKEQGINKNAALFYFELLDLFEFTDSIQSTSKKLADKFGTSERTIQRYVLALKNHNLIHVRPHYNNDNPDKTYIEFNSYSSTSISDQLKDEAVHYLARDKHVHFQPGLF